MTPDRDLVVKGLEVCMSREPGEYTCYRCPYEIDGKDCEINLMKDAIALLREDRRSMKASGRPKLNPCPKCGSTRIRPGEEITLFGKIYAIHCLECKACLKSKSESALCRVWNKGGGDKSNED